MVIRRKDKTKTKVVNRIDDENVHDADELDEGGRVIHTKVKFIRMWPRAIFTTPAEGTGKPGKPPAIAKTIPELNSPGVYILYRDDHPYYVGQTTGKLRSRIGAHAISVGGLRTYFWNYFSAFLVDDPDQIDEIEAILISAMPSVLTNKSAPRLDRQRMGKTTRAVIRKLREGGKF